MKVQLQVSGSPVQAAASAADIAARGADGLFTFEGQHDVFFPLLIAAGTTSLDLMTNVAIAPPRSPLHMAHSAYDLQLYSGGRFRLGLGSQIKVHIEKRYGSKWESPAPRMAEAVSAIKAIFAAWEGQARLDFRGDFYTHTIMAPNFNPGPNPFGPPAVLLGALGPVMTRTAAEVADGLLVMPFNSARHFADRTVPAIAEGLRRSGRTFDEFQIIAQAMVAVGRDDAELATAINGVASLIAFYGSTPAYLPVLQAEGWDDIQPELNALSKQGEWKQMGTLVDDDILRTFAVVAEPDQVGDELLARFGDLVDRVSFYAPYQATAGAFAPAIERLRSA